MKIACLYLTHINSKCDFNLTTLVQHIKESPYDIDLYVYSNNEMLGDIINIRNNYYEFAYSYLKIVLKYDHMFYYNQEFNGKCQLPLIDLWIKHPEYDGYIFYEDDTSYIGIHNMFDLFDFDSDVMFGSVRKLNWEWDWYKLNKLHNLKLDPYSGLLNVYYMKPHVIKEIYDFMLQGNFAHHEYLINSFVMCNYEKYNWKIGYLKGNNEFEFEIPSLKYAGDDFIHPIKNSFHYVKYVNKHSYELFKKHNNQK